MINNNSDFDFFVRNLSSLINFTSSIPLCSHSYFDPFTDHSFLIATFNVNELTSFSSLSLRELHNLFFINHLALYSVIDTHILKIPLNCGLL